MPRSLTEYQRKRDFSKTPEPRGTPQPGGTNRFVVQKHWATRLHYDFRLEMEGVLVSWAIPKGPTLNPAERRLAAHVEDHPVDYFDFEGLIPKGEYGGGTVMIWDWGTYSLEESPPAASLARGELKFRLEGQKLRGRYALVRTRSEKDWLLIKKRDEAADPSFDIESLGTSVKTGRTREQIEAGADAVWSSRREPDMGGLIDLQAARKAPMPSRVEVMKATLVDAPFDDEAWLFEIKWDGVRVVSFLDGGRIELRTRRLEGAQVQQRYPELMAVPAAVKAKQAILDGEVIAYDDEGRPSFEALQRLHSAPPKRIEYQVFDLLYLDGQLLYRVPLETRKHLLRNILQPNRLVRYSDHVVRDGRALFEQARTRRLEGIVAKRRDSVYEPGKRSRAWLKIKALLQQEVVIGGYTAPRAGRKHFGALIVGVYQDGELRYAGHVGAGFDEDSLARIAKELRARHTARSPFAGKPPKTNEPEQWVKPELACEVKFSEWTRDGQMRQPVFLGMRDDVRPRDVQRERPEAADRTRRLAARAAPTPETNGKARRSVQVKPTPKREANPPAAAVVAALRRLDQLGKVGDWEIGGQTVHVTNLDKVLFPEDKLTKRDLIRFYCGIAPLLLPYLKDRPLSMNPHPDGIHGKSYWVKDKPGYAPDWIETFEYRDEKAVKHWILVNDVATLAWVANHAVIDLHPWYSRADRPEYPDWAVVDLDPAQGATFADVVMVAKVVKAGLDHLRLTGFPKTTGKRGIHIYIPIERRYTFEETRGFTEKLARMIAQVLPDKITEEWSKARRTGKIRIDYTQNVINKTLAGPYSVRPEVGAPVSTPITWEELDDPTLRPNGWTVKNIDRRVKEKGDLFRGALELRQRLPKL
jgi:bifunctional non-homologous end joining protein LigD